MKRFRKLNIFGCLFFSVGLILVAVGFFTKKALNDNTLILAGGLLMASSLPLASAALIRDLKHRKERIRRHSHRRKKSLSVQREMIPITELADYTAAVSNKSTPLPSKSNSEMPCPKEKEYQTFEISPYVIKRRRKRKKENKKHL